MSQNLDISLSFNSIKSIDIEKNTKSYPFFKIK